MNIIFISPMTEGTMKDSLIEDQYNSFRAHSYYMCKIAKELGARLLDFGTSKYPYRLVDDLKLTMEGLNMTFEDSDLIDTSKDFNVGFLQIFGCWIPEDRFIDYLNSVDKIIYYVSDFELSKSTKSTEYRPYVLTELAGLSDGPYSSSTIELLRSKLIGIISTFDRNKRLMERLFGVPVYHVPMMINEFIPVLNSPKVFDAFNQPVNPTDFLNLSKDLSVIMLGNRGYSQPGSHSMFLQSEDKDNTSILDLIHIQSLCRYMLSTNRDYYHGEDHKVISNSTYQDTHKLIECYYAGCYPISPNKLKVEVEDYIRNNKSPDIDSFRESLLKIRSYECFRDTTDNIIKLILENETIQNVSIDEEIDFDSERYPYSR